MEWKGEDKSIGWGTKEQRLLLCQAKGATVGSCPQDRMIYTGGGREFYTVQGAGVNSSQTSLRLVSIQPSHPVVSFSSCLQCFLASGSYQMSQFFASGGQSIGVSASASVLPMNIQDWFPLGWTGLIFLQSQGLSRVFSNIKVQKHQFFSAQLSL